MPTPPHTFLPRRCIIANVRVGNVEIASFSDLSRSIPLSQAFPAVSLAEWARYADLYPEAIADGVMTGPVSAFVLRTPSQTVLVDMGIGPGPFTYLGGATGALTAEMERAGVDLAGVDIVVFTHLHADHTGWTTVGGEALCSKARHIAPEKDWPLLGQAPGFGPPEPLQGLLERGLLELVSGETQVTSEIGLTPSPGHTPGHQSVTIESQGERGLIAGDLAVNPATVEETDWAFFMETDPNLAASTRREVMHQLEENGGIVGFAHFPEPGLGRVLRDGELRIFKPV
jgi:glyoxylase-like metal-dependent hydrolase (beta-lactamase superfamily II)